jgi:hypothetical protein
LRATNFQPRTRAQKRKALAKVLLGRKWKAGLTDEEKPFLVSEIR